MPVDPSAPTEENEPVRVPAPVRRLSPIVIVLLVVAGVGLLAAFAVTDRRRHDRGEPVNAQDHGTIPTIQTIEGPLAGHEESRYPDLSRGGLTFRQAKCDGGAGKQAGLFGE